MSFAGNNVAHATLRIFHVALVTGYDMDMDMKNTLSGCLPDVNADVVAVRFELRIQQCAFLVYQHHAGVDLFGCQVKKIGDMTTWDDQGMPRTHRIGIASTVCKFVLQ